MYTKFDKAIVAFLGVALNFLYSYNVSHPNHWVSLALAVLTVLGVHQVPNQV